MKLLQELRHENIIRYNDSFFEEGVLFIVFEWAAGGDLKKVVREAASPLDESVIWSYFTQISEGLQHMHNLRMVRRAEDRLILLLLCPPACTPGCLSA